MSDEWIALLSAALVAVVSGGVTLLSHRLTRKDSKEDKHDEIVERLDKLDSKIDALAVRVDETAVVQARVRILRFADEITHKTRHCLINLIFNIILLCGEAVGYPPSRSKGEIS